MKGLFHAFQSAPRDFASSLRHATIILDTNVLLNLYRYKQSTRDELLLFLEALRPRLWIPYQVALEFQRNRLIVIAAQNRKLLDVEASVGAMRKAIVGEVEKHQLRKRYSLVDPAHLLDGFNALAETFTQQLHALRSSQPSVSGPDPLQERLNTLFDGRVGPAPSSQEQLAALFKQGEMRYKARIPPGYDDADKDLSSEYFQHEGLLYRRKFGDYLVWNQIVQHVASAKLKHVVFVTDDATEDWWQIVRVDGPKTIGPRPELIEEARAAGAEEVIFYNPETFLQYTGSFLSDPVSEEALEDVRDVSTPPTPTTTLAERLELLETAERAVQAWLQEQFPHVTRRDRYPDFEVETEGSIVGIEVKLAPSAAGMRRRVKEAYAQARYELSLGYFNEIMIVWAVFDSSTGDKLQRAIESAKAGLAASEGVRVSHRIGLLGGDEQAPRFLAFYYSFPPSIIRLKK